MGILDLVLDVDVLVEGKLAGERNIDNHPCTPHVQGPIETTFFEHIGTEDLRNNPMSALAHWILIWSRLDGQEKGLCGVFFRIWEK